MSNTSKTAIGSDSLQDDMTLSKADFESTSSCCSDDQAEPVAEPRRVALDVKVTDMLQIPHLFSPRRNEDDDYSSAAVTTMERLQDVGFEAQPRSKLLSLPYEIRRNIYRQVWKLHRARHKELMPWYPTPTPRVRMFRLVVSKKGDGQGGDDHDDDGAAEEKRQGQMLSPHRPVGYIPSALLVSCRQVHSESGRLALQENEFVFESFFSSGLAMARSQMMAGRLGRWHFGLMRWVLLEVRPGDFSHGGDAAFWKRLCGVWADSVRGMRLGIVGDRNQRSETEKVEDDSESGEVEWEGTCLPGGVGWRWAGRLGLARMKALKRLEVDLQIGGWSRARKLRWCEKLRSVMARAGSTGVEVVCVERVYDES